MASAGFLTLPLRAAALPEIEPTFPRLANYFLHWTISSEEALQLAKFDLVILDAEVQERSREELRQIKTLNSKIILLAYVPASEIRRDVSTLSQIAPVRFKLGARVPDTAYLKDAGGSRLSFWPGTWIADVTDTAPRFETPYGSLRWNEYLPQYVAREILSTGLWDGVFYDNAWDDILHFARTTPDLNRDGVQDSAEAARAAWVEGLRSLYRRTHAVAPNFFVFENDGPLYAPEVHGVLLESFPRKGWARHVQELERVRTQGIYPAIAILNANTFNSGARDDFRAMRYGLASAFLNDAFYSFDFGDQDHGQTWQYDEYGVFLGEPLNTRTRVRGDATAGVWRRDFEQGIVVVNSTAAVQEVNLPIEVEKIRGTQDSLVNDGLITRTIRVGATDGLLVLRPLQIIPAAVYENGVFARVFNAAGEAVRAGFFAFDKKEVSGVTLARIDLDGDQKEENLRVQSGKVTLQFGDATRSTFAPFGETWQGALSLDFGDVNRDGIVELIFGQGLGGGQVRVFRPNGNLLTLPFFPFGGNYRGGVNVAVGDLNGDGFSEIVVGAGPGGGPQVRIFGSDGRLLSGGFFAYDPRFRGGVRVAVGDTDGDGSAEIITGPGPGGGPQVRIFDGLGRALSPGFFAFDRASRAGVEPIVADVNRDGSNEILAVTKEIL